MEVLYLGGGTEPQKLQLSCQERNPSLVSGDISTLLTHNFLTMGRQHVIGMGKIAFINEFFKFLDQY
jgi:hypothetical protein